MLPLQILLTILLYIFLIGFTVMAFTLTVYVIQDIYYKYKYWRFYKNECKRKKDT